MAQPIGAGPAGVEQRALGASIPGDSANTPQFKREPKVGKVPYSEEALAMAQRTSDAPPAVTEKPEQKPEARPESKPAVAGDVTAGASDAAWMWPSSGRILGQFSEAGSKGVDIAGKAGDPVLAAGDGGVVYSGTGLRGYGKLIIVKSTMPLPVGLRAHNQTLLVKEGRT